MIDRRTILAAAAAAAAAPALARATSPTAIDPAFSKGFLWGASTAGHQIEGNNSNSDTWFLENVKPTVFAEPSRDAANSFHLWPTDMDIAKAMGLNTYRFSVEWARVEPEPGLFSVAMLDHYKRMVAGARERGLHPIVTYNHFTAPRWFAAQNGWLNPDSAAQFARYCDRVTRHMGDGIGHAITFNEPNLMRLLATLGLPPPKCGSFQTAMLIEAARRSGTPKFATLNAVNREDIEPLQASLRVAHKAGRAAIKAARGNLPVGLSLAMFDDQAVGKNSMRDAVRKALYQDWLEVARGDDFFGVQNYERVLWGDKGKLPVPPESERTYMGGEIYHPSLAGAVRYAYSVAKVPIIVTEHGVGSDDDTIRARLIPGALAELEKAINDGIPVLGYCHWSLIDNFEWIFGYKPHFGLHSVDPVSFERTAKPSAAIYGAIARRNAL